MKQTLLLISIFLFTAMNFNATFPVNNVQTDSSTIYPNPVKDHFMYSAAEKISRISIYNIIGKKVKEYLEPIEGQELFVEDLNQGLYLVELYNNEGRVLSVKRLKKL